MTTAKNLRSVVTVNHLFSSMSSLGDSSWTYLTRFDFTDSSMGSNLVRFSDTEFMIMHGYKLHKYDTKINKWDIIYDNYNTSMTDNKYILFDTTNKKVYTSGSGKLKII